MDLKQEITKDIDLVIKGLKDGSLDGSNIFKKYPKVMLMMGYADTAYYRKASGCIFAPVGIYILDTPDRMLTKPANDKQSLDGIVTRLRLFKALQLPDLASEDISDMLNGNSDQMAGTTSSAWNAEHAYYIP